MPKKPVRTIDYQNVFQAITRLLQVRSTQDTYQTIVDSAVELTSAKFGSLFIMKSDQLYRVYATSNRLYQIIPRSNGNTYASFINNRSYLLPVKTIEKFHPEINRLKVSSDITVPLSYADQVVAVISVLSPQNRPFTRKDLKTVKFFAPPAALAIKNAIYYDQAAQAIKDRDWFISMASHEIKTPITAVSAYAQIIKRKIKNRLKPSLKHITKLERSVDRLTRLIDELLQVKELGQGKLHFKKRSSSLIPLLKNAMTEFNYRYPNHRLHFYQRHARHAKIFADPDKITQVFNNILSNAGKFSPENSLISISVTGTHDIWKVSITDRGTGIDPADLPNIFERYYQGKTDKPRGGIGLGLHLVKQILDHHQAHIHYQSRPGEGTKVTILFPQA